MAYQFAMADRFMDSLCALHPREQAKVNDVLRRFKRDPNPHGGRWNLKHPEGTRSDRVWSLRATQDLRIILYEEEGTWYLLHVGHHDEAYAWARRYRPQRHPRLGSLQIVAEPPGEALAAMQPAPAPAQPAEPDATAAEAPAAPSGPFAAHDPDYLVSLGVPTDWVPVLQALPTENAALDAIVLLPKDVQERLFQLLEGKRVEPPRPEQVELEQGEQFYLVQDEEDLERVLRAPMERWIAFLHADQRRLVEAEPRGPVKITGSAGTGKTVVALHRARRLARQGRRVLLTSFTRTLVEHVREQLALLCSEAELERIRVETVHGIACELIRQAGLPEPRPAARVGREDPVREALQRLAPELAPDVPLSFLREEWERVVAGGALRSAEEYVAAPRRGRSGRLGEKRRRALWPLFAAVIERLEAQQGSGGYPGWPWVARHAAELLEQGRVEAPFDAVVVDEVQDLKAPEVRLLRAVAARRDERLANLTLLGDGGQRIYPGGFRLKDLGIDTRGRGSAVLRVNYRTTHHIRLAADRVLAGGAEALDDLDPEELRLRDGVRSLRLGEPPRLQGHEDWTQELRAAVEQVERWMAQGLRPEAIGLFARTNRRATELRDALRARGVDAFKLEPDAETPEGAVRVGTMHRAKGLEFKAVLLAACRSGEVPPASRCASADGEEELERMLREERRLLYVAMTRARDHLVLSWHGAPSELLRPLLERGDAAS